MSLPRNVRGHFASLWVPGGPILIPTTITSHYKSKAREREIARRARLAAELEALTGQKTKLIARSIDGISRRWTGVKSHTSD
jgi:hypothetical protein